MATLARVRMPDLVAVRALHVSRALAAVQIKMPSLSPTMEEGTIVKWMKVRQIYGKIVLVTHHFRLKETR